MFNKKTIKDIDLKNKTVLLRADYNVPLVDGRITDDYRLKKSLNTIKQLLNENVKLVICSHLGRPNGQSNQSFSLKPVARALSRLLDKEIKMANDCIGQEVSTAVKELKNGQLMMLENLRFHREEEANDENFAKELADLADIFVQDGFGVVHRRHASTDAITHYLPSVAGLLLENEVVVISQAMHMPKRPLMAIVGGAKIADKLEILKRFIKLADVLAVGGALANPLLKAQGIDIEDSLYDSHEFKLAKKILLLTELEQKHRPFSFIMPHDSVVAKDINSRQKTRLVDFSTNFYADVCNYPRPVKKHDLSLEVGDKILDIGPFTAALVAGSAQLAGTVIWNGTMGVTETKSLIGLIGPYAHGTEVIIESLSGEFGQKPFVVVGGGDTVGYLENRRLISHFNHVSTGGGASLELMSGHKLPGVEALLDK